VFFFHTVAMKHLLHFALLFLALASASAQDNARGGFADADFEKHIAALKRKLPADGGFSVCIEKPFVVVGDLPPDKLRSIAEGSVRWAVRLLRKDHFKNDPDHIIDIWLFKDATSYRKHVREIFGDTPTTPFGYYAPRHRALIMNIATGTGTLIHEMVHPYMAANFPRCPAWFNEGLGSLYEQCGERGGNIVGFTNWRLAGLQRGIESKKLPTFKELCSTNDREFYGDDRGTNYAQARYLLYYLQERGLLHQFHRDFLANQKDDPTGYKTLVKTLNETDMDAFQKKWEQFVMKLKFP
jgi:hypothetical protein